MDASSRRSAGRRATLRRRAAAPDHPLPMRDCGLKGAQDFGTGCRLSLSVGPDRSPRASSPDPDEPGGSFVRIAFVSGNREKLPDAVIPLGVLYVMASTPDHHEKLLVDLCFEARPVEALRRCLTAFRPDLVALGMRNIQSNDYSGIGDNLAYYGRLIAAIRGVSATPIVMGGAGFSVMPRELMERLRPDYGISGEAERAFPALVEALEGDTSRLARIGSLHRIAGGEVISNLPERDFLDMNRLAVPDRRLVDPRYVERYGIDSIQTKRGCPLRCEYCTYPLIEGRVGRTREPAAVVDEMFRVLEEQPDTRHLFIVDSVFNLPKAHAKAVCRVLIARGWRGTWTCCATTLGFDREFAELARAAGCAGMEIGSDSGCDEVLTRLRKGFTVEQIRALHRLCSEVGIPDCHTFILGTRGESLDDVRRTLDFVLDLDPYSAILMIWVDDYESLDAGLRRERRRLRQRVEELLLGLDPRPSTWAIPPLGINFDPGLFRRLRQAGLHGPLWQHMRPRPPAVPARREVPAPL